MVICPNFNFQNVMNKGQKHLERILSTIYSMSPSVIMSYYNIYLLYLFFLLDFEHLKLKRPHIYSKHMLETANNLAYPYRKLLGICT